MILDVNVDKLRGFYEEKLAFSVDFLEKILRSKTSFKNGRTHFFAVFLQPQTHSFQTLQRFRTLEKLYIGTTVFFGAQSRHFSEISRKLNKFFSCDAFIFLDTFGNTANVFFDISKIVLF
jgi:hypothetical protein